MGLKGTSIGRLTRACSVVAILAAAAPALQAQTAPTENGPMSAIDWLSDSLADPQEFTLDEPATSTSAAVESISVQSLDAPSPDAAGLLPPSVTGFPARLWGNAQTNQIIEQIVTSPRTPLPALSALRREILLAEAAAPENGNGRLLLARIDKLLELGFLEDSHALVSSIETRNADLFRREFDIALLLGRETEACNDIRSAGGVALSYQVRVFCLARNGDWNAAVLTLNSADILGELNPGEYDLIARFLDPEMFEGDPDLPVPSHPSPLVYRMYEALGQPIPTRILPLAFSQADLREVTGWKLRIEAAERLGRIGAVPDNRLLGIYTERQAAASGGVWDRVKIVQNMDVALRSGDTDAISRQLPALIEVMQENALQRPLANIFAPRLTELINPEVDGEEEIAPLVFTDESLSLIRQISLLSDTYETVPAGFSPTTPREIFLESLAQGLPAAGIPDDPAIQAVIDGFDGAALTAADQVLLDDGRVGELLLHAISRFGSGTEGDLSQVTSALRLLRSLGREDTARQAALQFLLISESGASY